MPPLPPSFTADPDPPGSRFLIVFEKLRTGITKSLITESDTLLKAVAEHIIKNFGIGEDVSLHKVLKQIVFYFSTLLSPTEYARSKELAKVLTVFLTRVSQFEDVRCILRDENGILKFLTPILCNETNADDHYRLMTLIEILSRDMLINWKIPYMVNLINHSVDRLLQGPEGTPTILQFLLNVCRKNHCCVLILRSCVNYKPAWKVLRAQFVNSTDVRVDILVSHLNYLAEVCIPVKSFLSGYDLATLAMKEALDTSNEEISFERFCDLTEAVRQMMESICEKMKFIFAENPSTSLSSSREQADSIITAKNQFLELLTTFQVDLSKFVGTEPSRLSDQAQQNILSMIFTCLLPYSVTTSCDSTLLRNCKAGAETTCQILSQSDDKMQIRYQAFGVILRISELIFESKDSLEKAIMMEFISSFKNVIKAASLCTDSPMVGLKLEMNIILVRLYGALLFEPQVKEIIKKQLTGRLVRELFAITLRDISDRRQRYRQSVFAVELMTLLCRFSEAPEILGMLLEQLSVPEIVNHISNCIRNGDEKEIAKALHLISSVAFNRSSVWATAKSLKQAQDQLINIPETPVDMIPSFSNNWSSSRSDIEIMDYVVDSQKDPSTNAMSDVLSWCQLRREVHQHEIGMLNSHIFQLNRTISNLNILLEKQSNFVAKHMAANEQKDLEVATLQHRHENVVKESEAKLKSVIEESRGLKDENVSLVEKTNLLNEQIRNLQREVESLQTGQKTLEEKKANLAELLKQAKEDKKNLREELRKVKSEADTASAKIKGMEKDFKQKVTDCEHLQQSLEKKQKMIDAIQGIVGKNFPFDM